jgi:prophage regulatory protein
MAQKRIIRIKEVIRRVGLSRSSIYLSIQIGCFPKQFPLGSRSVGWLEEEIEQWISDRRNGDDL